jgi:hypothetical protein
MARDHHETPLAGARHECKSVFRSALGLPTLAFELLNEACERCAQVAALIDAPTVDELPLQVSDDGVVRGLRIDERMAGSAAHGAGCRGCGFAHPAQCRRHIMQHRIPNAVHGCRDDRVHWFSPYGKGAQTI